MKQRPWSEIVTKTADERIARMSGCEESLVNRIRELEQDRRDLAAALHTNLAARDAAWERAMREEFGTGEQWFRDVGQHIAAVKARLDAGQQEQTDG